MKSFVLGTRGSALALAQTRLVLLALERACPGVDVRVETVVTSGDKNLQPTAPAGLKGLFTKEIEEKLLNHSIDLAVHSLKDLPGQISPELRIGAVLERADTADLLISRDDRPFAELPPDSRIGTSSVRRKMQLLWKRPDLKIVEIRGNVPTRLRKLRETGDYDAIVLARAGLDRLQISLDDLHTEVLDILPAIGQGAIAIEHRWEDEQTAFLCMRINHEPTFCCIRAERELLRLLDGDCNLPVGVRTKLDGSKLRIEAMIFHEEIKEPIFAEDEGDAHEPEALAARLFSAHFAK
jgi:hydroxymethylbilane synthase